MATIDEQGIKEIVTEVLKRIQSESGAIVQSSQSNAASSHLIGVYNTVDEAANAAEKAQKELMNLSLEKRGEIIAAIRKAGLENAERMAKLTVEETGMGRVKDKIAKFTLIAEKTPGIEDLTTDAWSGDHGLTIVEMAPYGVIGAVPPSTHPVPTLMNNAISFIAAGNSGVFNAHPASKNVFALGIDIFNRAIMNAGGPANLVTCIHPPTIESAHQMFNHPKIRVLLVTGGPAVVRAALSTPKKAICAGPGNPPVVVDETADIPNAAQSIIEGASFDNNLVCIAEKEIFVVSSVADALKREMLRRGCYELNSQQIEQLTKIAFQQGKGEHSSFMVNRALVGKDASVLAKAIGLDIDPSTPLLIGETHFDHPFVQEEQLMPFIPIVRTKDADEAIAMALKAEHGYGHTSLIHSRNIENMSKMAKLVNTTIFIKNGSSLAGLGFGGEGFTSFSIATPTGEGLTSARTFTRKRRCSLVNYFRII